MEPAEEAAATPARANRRIPLGRIGAPHGVRGWVRVISDTAPPDNIFVYQPWLIDDAAMVVLAGRRHGNALIAKLQGYDDREAAAALAGRPIEVERAQLPAPQADEFYWVDLEGLAVRTLDGTALGRVSHLLPTGANDVMVVQGERERLLPFVWQQVVKDVDFVQGCIVVDWDPDF